MPLFLLIRHGHNDAVGRTIVGRTAGIHLNQQGSEQAERLAERLAEVPLAGYFQQSPGADAGDRCAAGSAARAAGGDP